MADLYRDRVLQETAPARKAVAVTKSDTVPLASVPRTIYVGVAGDITAILADDTSAVLFKAVPVGPFPVMVKQIMATGTTATDIVALY